MNEVVVVALLWDWSGALDEMEETILRDIVTMLLVDVDEESIEDSTALASAIETFAFALAKLVSQMLIWFSCCVQTSYSWLQHQSAILDFNFANETLGGEGGNYILAPSFEHEIWPGPGEIVEPPVQLFPPVQQVLENQTNLFLAPSRKN